MPYPWQRVSRKTSPSPASVERPRLPSWGRTRGLTSASSSHTPTLPQDQPCAWLWICGWQGGQQTARFEKLFGHRVKNADLRVTLISFPQLLQTNSHSPTSLIFLINGLYNYISFRDVQQQKL